MREPDQRILIWRRAFFCNNTLSPTMNKPRAVAKPVARTRSILLNEADKYKANPDKTLSPIQIPIPSPL